MLAFDRAEAAKCSRQVTLAVLLELFQDLSFAHLRPGLARGAATRGRATGAEIRPAGAPLSRRICVKVLQQGISEDARYQREGAWRCCLCYDRRRSATFPGLRPPFAGASARFKTMDFAPVPADSPDWCPKCQKPRKERLSWVCSYLQQSFTSQIFAAFSTCFRCGWSLWIPFADLPPKRQASSSLPASRSHTNGSAGCSHGLACQEDRDNSLDQMATAAAGRVCSARSACEPRPEASIEAIGELPDC